MGVLLVVEGLNALNLCRDPCLFLMISKKVLSVRLFKRSVYVVHLILYLLHSYSVTPTFTVIRKAIIML